MRGLAPLLVALLTAGCATEASTEVELAIDLRTDRDPVSDFATLTTRLERAPEAQVWSPPAWAELVRGVRAAEYRALPLGGEDTLTLALLDRDGREVAEARRLVTLDVDLGVRVDLPAPWIVAGAFASCVVANGRRQCWGSRAYHEAGVARDAAGAPAVLDEPPVRALCMGIHEACVVGYDGALRCLEVPQEGTSTLHESSHPGLRAIACSGVFGVFHRCHLDDDDAIACSGADNVGQLGNGEDQAMAPRDAPTAVTGLPRARRVTVGAAHSCALVDGVPWCWGQNGSAQLGDGTTEDRTSPVRIPGVEEAIAIDALGRHTCVVTAARRLVCWGYNNDGIVERGGPESVATPRTLERVTEVVEVATGNGYTCARDVAGVVRCWGANERGQLGDGTTTSHADPSEVPLPGPAVAIDAGFNTACAVVDDGAFRVFCWGSDEFGGVTGDVGGDRLSPFEVALAEPLYSSQ